jgi:hypothetical protein
MNTSKRQRALLALRLWLATQERGYLMLLMLAFALTAGPGVAWLCFRRVDWAAIAVGALAEQILFAAITSIDESIQRRRAPRGPQP